MDRHNVGDFKYFVGTSSLAQIATREDRVCVLNILGGESSEVTPVSHSYSGGNVVFGTAPGKGGQVLETPIGNIPVFNNVRDGLAAGYDFNCGVVYLPPSAARDGVAELIRVNPELRKIFIITEKIAVHDAREIRAMGQQRGVDIFGANGLGVADAWNQVRIGGALGGDNPGDTLRRGSIAIFSNSGGFSTTIAQYLRMAGWGTTTVISSGKDVYIHYAAPEFAFALANDARSKAAVLYCEPGGYYELDANFTKPVVACVVGRWKSKLTRAVGHAGAMAGGSDDALAKERWFMQKFGVDGIFTPSKPVFSAKGALVTNIAHIPAALTEVMRANATMPDFTPEGSLALKPWFGANQGLDLPAELDMPVVEAIPPYNEQIAQVNRQIGAIPPREPLKDASGASQMDAVTQVSSLHGVSMLDASTQSLEGNVSLALLRESGGENDRKLIDVAIAAYVNLHGTPELAAAQAAREAGNAPNAVLATAAAIVGPRRQEAARAAVKLMIDRFDAAGLANALDESFDFRRIDTKDCPIAGGSGARFAHRGDARGCASARREIGVRALARDAAGPSARRRGARRDHDHARVGTTKAQAHLAPDSREPAMVDAAVRHDDRRVGGCIAASARPFLRLRHPCDGRRTEPERNQLCGAVWTDAKRAGSVCVPNTCGLAANQRPRRNLGARCEGRGVRGRPRKPRARATEQGADWLPDAHRLYPWRQRLRGNRVSQRAVPQQQPQKPGGSRSRHRSAGAGHGIRRAIRQYKAQRKNTGSLDIAKIPGVNHPVFKDKPVNHDPREVFIAELV